MANALDMFRALREAANSLHARLTEISALLATLRAQIDGLALHPELKAVLHDEQIWLAQAQETLREVRIWREHEKHRFWFAVFWRWVLACAFALAAVAVAGASYAWATRPYLAELEQLRSRAELAQLIERRLAAMTPAERRDFEKLMNIAGKPKR